jgi:hypothetical protein
MHTASIALMMAAIRTSETLVYVNDTARCYVLESCHIHTRRYKNQKYHKIFRDFCLMKIDRARQSL